MKKTYEEIFKDIQDILESHYSEDTAYFGDDYEEQVIPEFDMENANASIAQYILELQKD